MDFFKTTLSRVLIVLLCVFLVTVSIKTLIESNNIQRSYYEQYKKTITVNADDKVMAKPDIATISLSVVSKGKTVTEVTTDGNKKMNDIITALKAMQVDEKDIQTTNYYLNPEQDYLSERIPPQAPKIIGYSLNQGVSVKVRKVDQVGDVLQKATSLGANEVGNIGLTIDDQDTLKDQAREKAFAKAREKAATLARQAGVQLGSIVSFNDDEVTPTYSNYYDKVMPMSAPNVGAAAPAPSIETGSQEVHASVTITYEIY